MADHYASIEDAQASVGMIFSDSTRPTTAQADTLLNLGDGDINKVVKLSENMVDTYGFISG